MKVSFYSNPSDGTFLRVTEAPEWQRNMLVDMLRCMVRGKASPLLECTPLRNEHSIIETRVAYELTNKTEEAYSCFVHTVLTLVDFINL